MRRCYRNVALALGFIIFASNTFSNSCSVGTLNVYAAEDTLTERPVAAENIKLAKTFDILNNVTVAETLKNADNLAPAKVSVQEEIHSGEENVETEIPADESESHPPVEVAEDKNSFELNDNEYTVLLKIVEAEAGSEDLTGKMLVANVIMNRVNSDLFPNTVTEVVYQKHKGRAQFSPTEDGRINSVTVSSETVEAVRRVMNGEDSSNGALYFRSVYSNSGWFDSALTRVVEHGNHIFYI